MSKLREMLKLLDERTESGFISATSCNIINVVLDNGDEPNPIYHYEKYRELFVESYDYGFWLHGMVGVKRGSLSDDKQLYGYRALMIALYCEVYGIN